MRKCTRCNEYKAYENFTLIQGGAYYKSWCKRCSADYFRENYKKGKRITPLTRRSSKAHVAE